MALSDELISQFAKITKDDKNEKEPQVYGTIVEYNGSKYVKLDGSDLLTPISSTAAAEPDDRVTVSIKNHTAIVTGNISSPSARETDVVKMGSKISEFEIVIADKVDTIELTAANARIDSLQADNVLIRNTLTANAADIDILQADYIIVKDSIDANEANITELKAENVDISNKLTAVDADIDSIQADNVLIRDSLTANSADITSIKTYNTDVANQLTAVNASIQNLETGKLSATDADLKYANIDFSNIGEAAMEYFYANSGLIEDVTIGDGTITGHLVGVTISGDLIEGNTIVAEKLVIKGDDGLYYKLNTDGVTTELEQTDYNSINGSVIKAKSITATKIDVKDLVAFDATIGGFKITDNSIYSGVKSAVDNTTRGVYLDNDGQVAFGDGHNFIQFFKDENNDYKLVIAADTMTFGSNSTNVETVVTELGESVADAANTSDTNSDRLTYAESTLTKLADSISTLVRGENGESLMTQTDDGWVFSIANILDTINNATSDINDLNEETTNMNSVINALNESVADLGIYTEYIKFGVDNGQPCITLGETDSAFKVVITNTDIRFMEGTSVPARINNQSLNIEKAVISNELKQGGFVWMARDNGNYGILWRGE